jgi:hypothetical protein
MRKRSMSAAPLKLLELPHCVAVDASVTESRSCDALNGARLQGVFALADGPFHPPASAAG